MNNVENKMRRVNSDKLQDIVNRWCFALLHTTNDNGMVEGLLRKIIDELVNPIYEEIVCNNQLDLEWICLQLSRSSQYVLSASKIRVMFISHLQNKHRRRTHSGKIDQLILP